MTREEVNRAWELLRELDGTRYEKEALPTRKSYSMFVKFLSEHVRGEVKALIAIAFEQRIRELTSELQDLGVEV